jgi:hypothetical protein
MRAALFDGRHRRPVLQSALIVFSNSGPVMSAPYFAMILATSALAMPTGDVDERPAEFSDCVGAVSFGHLEKRSGNEAGQGGRETCGHDCSDYAWLSHLAPAPGSVHWEV